MNIVAPRPKKPSSYTTASDIWTEEDNEACQELRQILLASHSTMMEDLNIIRTSNPLPHDTCFVPIHQTVSHLSVTDTTTTAKLNRPRSFSVGDSRNNYISLVH
ncbi:uncharacterized protein B0P05DRAFT_474792 [Gilbertella persicaria]|uniref:Uncharacterized protein n=1 Tax=Rhizopus stolonifer TaxID=4846 RepID=A0A367KJ24_RHIST|nr:uncharacterized protein B0P05DRAFT_474792 [Gilbertella persicaria]KAI8069092.1 hypothetical protein B0P05DRAFT_474792 [Gilbertella persicaria]RCI02177.1 hypothetical protein CU098_012237 [Rhizopus stolonifer]